MDNEINEVPRDEVEIAYYKLFTAPLAKIPYTDIMNQFSFFYAPTLTSNDPYKMAFNEGQRSVFCYIARMIQQGQDKLTKPQEDEDIIL